MPDLRLPFIVGVSRPAGAQTECRMARMTADGISVGRILLWLFVVVLAIGVGAGLYEALVIMPLWSHSPPESVRGWDELLEANPQYAPHGGDRFWIIVSPARALLAIAVLITALRMRGLHRRWRLIASLITLALFIIAAVWLIPVSAELFGDETAELSPEAVVSKTNAWVRLNYLFQILGIAAFLAALRALTIRSADDADRI